MIKIYSISDNSFDKRGFPWIDEIVEGLMEYPPCENCGAKEWYPSSEIKVHLERKKGSKWPDVLGCGHGLLFIVSLKVIEAWKMEGVGEFPIYRVHIQKPYPKKLEGTEPPEYYWIDGKRLQIAILDLEASGFVDAHLCPSCGHLFYDISATHRLQNSRVIPYVFQSNSWNGSHLFTSNVSYLSFYCTELVLECARKYKFLNFRFTPIEEGKATSSKGIDYLK